VLGIETGDTRAFPSFLLLGERGAELARYGPLAANPELVRQFEEEQGILISDRLARQRGLAVGDQVFVNTSGHGVQAFRVIAISDDYGYFFHPDERAYGVISAALLHRYFCIDVERTNSIAVKLAPGTDVGTVEALLRPRFPDADLRFYAGPNLLALMLSDLTTDFLVFDVILFLTALLAGLGVLNGQLLSAIERRKELGILQALGTTREQLTGVVLAESVVIGLLGGVLGCLVGLGLTPVLVAALRVLSGLQLPFRTGGAWVAFALGSAVLLTVLAGLYPVWRAQRMDAVRAVRTG